MKTSGALLRELLVEARLIDEARLAAAEEAAAQASAPLVCALHRMRLVEDRKIARLLSSRLGLERVDLDARSVHPQVLEEVAWRVAFRLRALPLGVRRDDAGAALYVAMSDPTLPGAVEELHGVTGMEIRPLVVEDGALERALRRHYPEAELPPPFASDELPSLEPIDEAPPVVVGSILDDGPAAPYLTDSTADVLALYLPRMGANARPALPSEEGLSVRQGRLADEEHLEDATREVLLRFAPTLEERSRAQTAEGQRLEKSAEPTIPDAPPLEAASRETSPQARSPQERGTPEAPPLDLRVTLGPLAVLSAEPRVSRFVASSLAPLAPAILEVTSFAELRARMRRTALEAVVLLDPRREPLLEGALRDLGELFQPPAVVVVSADPGFDSLAGVALRVPPPAAVTSLPRELALALSRIRR